VITQMITVESGFQYSVNIRYDFRNQKRIGSYIPTESFLSLINDIIASVQPHSTDRARIVVGPYGTGKSHLITVIVSLLMHSLEEDDYRPLFNKLHHFGYGSLVTEAQKLLEDKPFFTVILDARGRNLEQVFVRGLKQALIDAGLEALMPNTTFKSIEETLEMWRTKYKDTFEEFKKILIRDYQISFNEFLAEIKNYDTSSVEIFSEVFPSLCAGAGFDVFNAKDVPSMYREVSLLLQDRGYRGIYVIFDEFNKILENALSSKELVDLKLLQDVAEMCNRSGEEQVHLMLISHQHISQYASVLSEEVINTWRKVEGRFTAVNIRQDSAKSHLLISAVIKKETDQWEKHVAMQQHHFSRLLNFTRQMELFNDLGEEVVEKGVLHGCYPLHPATVFALPRVCNRLAQNERTLFTFLATNDLHTLGRFVEEMDQENFRLLTVDVLFDYFSESALKQRGRDSLGSSFMQAKEAMARLGNEPNLMALRIIKTLAVIIGLEESRFVPSTNILRFCLVHSDEEEKAFEEAFDILLERKIIYERKSDGRIHFMMGSDTDFAAAIQGIRGNYRYANLFNTRSILNEHFTPYPIIANRYNDEYEMTRFFYQEFFYADDLVRGMDWLDYLKNKNYADGVVAYIVCENEEECRFIRDYIDKNKHPQVIFVYTKKPLRGLSELCFDYLALHLLRKDSSLVGEDPSVVVELEAYLADYEEQIELALAPLVSYRSKKRIIFHCGTEHKNIRSRAELSRLVSMVCLNVFDETPKVNNELINRANVSKTVINARKKVIEALLSEVEEPQLGLTGYGPDVSIFRSMLQRPEIYRETGDSDLIVIDDRVEKEFLGVIEHIRSYLLASDSQPVTFANLFDELRTEPYGLRAGVLPVFLAIAFRDLKKRLLIRNMDGVEIPLDVELVEAISKNPYLYTVELIGFDSIKEKYLEQLTLLFEEFLPSDTVSHNYAYPVGFAMKRWFVDLPRYTRECRMHSDAARTFCRYLNIPMTDSTDLLFYKIPSLITGSGEFRVDEAEMYLEGIVEIKEELEVHLIFVRGQLEEIVKQGFGASGVNRSLADIIAEWYKGLSKRTRSYVFSGTAFKLLNLAKTLDSENSRPILDELITILVRLDLVDWSDETREKFEAELEQNIQSIMDIERESLPTVHHKVAFADENGEISERVYAKVEMSSLGQILYSELAAAMDGFADAITMDEKRQILLDLLKSMS